jgi:hypothetical protein
MQDDGTRSAPPPPDDEVPAAAEDSAPADLWHRLINEVGKAPGKHQLRLFMQELKPVSFRDDVLQVAYDEDVPKEHISVLLESGHLQFLAKCFTRICPGHNAKVLIKRWIDVVSSEQPPARLSSSPEIREKVEQNPFVRQVCDLFKGTVIDVRG